MKTIYRIIIKLKSGNAIHCRFPTRVSAEVMRRLCEELLSKKKRVVGIYCLDVTNMKYPDMSTPSPPHRSWKWCPTCGCHRPRFKHNGLTRCEICWCSSNSFDYRKANNTWMLELLKKTRPKKTRSSFLDFKSRQKQDAAEDKREYRRQRRLARKARKANANRGGNG